jgi:hypothetical protein
MDKQVNNNAKTADDTYASTYNGDGEAFGTFC